MKMPMLRAVSKWALAPSAPLPQTKVVDTLVAGMALVLAVLLLVVLVLVVLAVLLLSTVLLLFGVVWVVVQVLLPSASARIHQCRLMVIYLPRIHRHPKHHGQHMYHPQPQPQLVHLQSLPSNMHGAVESTLNHFR
jgi:hypothetical protein